MIVDLHTHTLFSDGVLVPAESVRRAAMAGYIGIAITDHADYSNYEYNLQAALRFKEHHNLTDNGCKVLAGVELTHVRPFQIADLVLRAKALGADIVTVHGETISEPVEDGTNRAAILAGVDILAHPGLITAADAELAARNGVYLEISTRKGHCLCNGHVARMAKLTGAALVINNDFHSPGDYVGREQALKVLMGAALTAGEAEAVIGQTAGLFHKKINR